MGARIEGVLESISTGNFVAIPEVDAVTIAEFIETNMKHKAQMGRDLEVKSQAVEDAVIELINKCLAGVDQPEIETTKYDWMDPEEMQKSAAGKKAEEGAASKYEIYC